MYIYICKLIKIVRVLLWVYGLLVFNGCSCNKPNEANKPELILFLGNTGVGKSALCNSIFQQNVFNSDLASGFGTTIHIQSHTYQNAIYIDTPGLSHEIIREQAAKEIEEALKKNCNYKIIFVITFKSGRLSPTEMISPTDIATVATVCEAIKVPFEYGLIFNKVTKGVMQIINQKGLEPYLTCFKKRPYATLILKMDTDIEDVNNQYFKADSENRKKLLEFISRLKSIQINKSDIQPFDIKNYDHKIQAIETK